MTLENTNPAAQVTRTGFGNIKAVAACDGRTLNQTLRDFQSKYVEHRYQVSAPRAALIAELAFGGRS
jgi:hypothetical protein